MNCSRDIQESDHLRHLVWDRDSGTNLPKVIKDAAWLQGALAADTVFAFQWDARAGVSRRSANALEILGFAPHETVTAKRFLAQIHPADRGLLNACVRGVRPGNPAYTVSFRFARPDGRQIWLEETSRAEFDTTGRLLYLRGLTRDVSWRRRHDEHQAMVLTELDHRVKNLLARVGAVISATRRQAASVDEYASALEGRIASLVNAHALLRDGRGASLSELAQNQLAPYATVGNTTLAGPEVTLSLEATEAMAMVLHELVTNGVKYGALSITDGHVAIQWRRNLDGSLRVDWREIGGPTINAQPTPGYGISLVRDLVQHELGGKVEFQCMQSGVNCTMILPAEHVHPSAWHPGDDT
jgi:PAS domain S-box-containing protein